MNIIDIEYTYRMIIEARKDLMNKEFLKADLKLHSAQMEIEDIFFKKGEKIMNDTFECRFCGDEGAFFNGVCYECPNCGEEWEDSDIIDGD